MHVQSWAGHGLGSSGMSGDNFMLLSGYRVRMEALEEDAISVDTQIEEGRTEISVSGTQEMAIIVESASGEQIYLPPEENSTVPEEGPYQPTGGGQDPYEGISDESPYDHRRQQEMPVGMQPTKNGFRIIHTEPVTSMSFIR